MNVNWDKILSLEMSLIYATIGLAGLTYLEHGPFKDKSPENEQKELTYDQRVG